MAVWNKLDSKINRPDLKGVEYRERHSTVFADNKLWFFGLRSVCQTSSNFHETTLLGTFVSIFDLKTKQWSFKQIDQIDEDENHREHIFATGDKVLMYVYSTVDGYYKLFQWKNDKWEQLNLDPAQSSVVKDLKKTEDNVSIKIFDAKDGFYIIYDASGNGHVGKMEITIENGEVKGAKQIVLSNINLEDKHCGAHLTGLALNKDKMFVWYGRQGCGFRWVPLEPLSGQLKSIPSQLQKKTISEPSPPYAFGGPYNTVMHDDKWIMLGGCRQSGLSSTVDCKEIWIFDVNTESFRKTNANTPEGLPHWRLSYTFDYSSGTVYVCDTENGIYAANLNNI